MHSQLQVGLQLNKVKHKLKPLRASRLVPYVVCMTFLSHEWSEHMCNILNVHPDVQGILEVLSDNVLHSQGVEAVKFGRHHNVIFALLEGDRALPHSQHAEVCNNVQHMRTFHTCILVNRCIV